MPAQNITTFCKRYISSRYQMQWGCGFGLRDAETFQLLNLTKSTFTMPPAYTLFAFKYFILEYISTFNFIPASSFSSLSPRWYFSDRDVGVIIKSVCLSYTALEYTSVNENVKCFKEVQREYCTWGNFFFFLTPVNFESSAQGCICERGYRWVGGWK